MNVKLISHTVPVDPEIASNLMELTAYIARVSNPSNQNNKETSERLINYCIKHKHWSVFEHCFVTLEITTTRDIARQILRHRGAYFQEFCLSGDTEIYFATPSQLKRGLYKSSSKYKLSDLYDKWINGASPIPNKSNSSINVRMPMKDRISQMNIKCFDEKTGLLTTSHIKEIFYTGKKEIYKITLSDGKEIKTTKEHKFLGDSGFDTLENIIGLEWKNKTPVMTKKSKIGTNGIPVYQDKVWLEEKKKESLFCGGGLKYLVEEYGINYNTLRKWLKKHNLSYTKKEVSLITDGPWNKGVFGYSTGERCEETRRNMQNSARKGSDSNLWRGGGSKKRQGIDSVDALTFRREKNHTCENCGSYGKTTDIHHIIPVAENPILENEKSNWKLLCRDCHIEHHKTEGYSGWQSMKKKYEERAEKIKQTAYTVKWASIEKIEYIGVEDTYDIEVEHSSHNYIANGIIAHNSQRYSDPTSDLGFVTREARLQDAKNRQNSIEVDDVWLSENWHVYQLDVIGKAEEAYKWAIENGIAKEQARSVLPEGLTISRMYMSNNIRNWLHYIQLRSGVETQKEHREVAIACADAIEPIFPMIRSFINE